MRQNLISIENTRFIFDTNFSGDPRRDKFGNDQRRANLVIPDIEQAKRMIDDGFNVKLTRPKEGEEEGFIPRYFVAIKLNYDSQWPPKVYLVTPEGNTVLLDADTICNVDDMWVENVNVVLNPYEGPNGKSLYVKSMEIFQKEDDDPITAKYSARNRKPAAEPNDEDYLPVN